MAPQDARNKAAAFVAALLLFSLTNHPACAQYMYLDTNGDGVHSAADIVAPSGVTTIDIWIWTNTNRDGTAAICNSMYGEPFTINSYEFILRADAGSVSWGAVTNRFGGSVDFGNASNAVEIHAGFGGFISFSPGQYRLASLTATVASGRPSLAFVATTSLGEYYLTGFGSRCPGNDFDNTLKLGSDWFDTDGAPYGGANSAPVLSAIPDVFMDEGQVVVRALAATDVDGDPIQFSKKSGPSYVTVATDSPGIGTATGTLTAAPGPGNAGMDSVTVEARDSPTSSSTTSFQITVTNAPAAPQIGPIEDMRVYEGQTSTQQVTAFDADGDPGAISFAIISGPAYVSVETKAPLGSTAQGTVLLAPPLGVIGNDQTTLVARKGSLQSEATFGIQVVSATTLNHPPSLGIQGSFVMMVNTTRAVDFSAYDQDGDALVARMESGPAYATLGSIRSTPPTLSGRVSLSPVSADVGPQRIAVAVSDGLAEALGTCLVTALATEAPAFSEIGDIEVGSGLQATRKIAALDAGTEYLTFTRIAGPSWMSVVTSNSHPQNAYGEIHVAPPLGVRGTFSAIIGVSDGINRTNATIQIAVYPACPATIRLPATVSWTPEAALTGDVNGDGRADIVSFESNSLKFGVLLGRGDGSFDSPMVVTNTFDPRLPLLADLNGDNRDDFIAIRNGFPTLMSRLAQPNGAFGDERQLPWNQRFDPPSSMSTGDVNGDGRLDLVASYTGYPYLLIQTFLGDGAGGFTIGPTTADTHGDTSALLRDFDGDGRVDLLALSGSILVLHRGDGAGGFDPGTTLFTFPQAATALAAGDLNDDRRPDLAVASGAGIAIFLGHGDGAFAPPRARNAEQVLNGLRIFDATGDGKADIVATGGAGYVSSAAYSLVFAGTGTDSVGPPTGAAYAAPGGCCTYAGGLAEADFDADGRMDWMSTMSGATFVFLNLGCGGSGLDQSPVLRVPAGVAATESMPLAFEIYAADPDAEPIPSLTASPLPAGSAFTPGPDRSVGTLTWTPGYDQAGEYDVTFRASNALSTTAVTRITVANQDRAPVIVAPPAQVGCAGSTVRFVVTAGDPDGDAITSLIARPLPPGATFTANSERTGGEFLWQTTPGSMGTQEIVFEGSNSLAGAAKTVIVIDDSRACRVAFEREAPDTTGPVGRSSSIQIDAAGSSCIAYTGGASALLRFARRGASGWELETVPQGGHVGGLDLALDSQGEPWISYTATEYLTPGALTTRTMVAHRSEGFWEVERVGSADPMSFGQTAIAFDPSGVPHVVYRGFAYQVLYASLSASGWTSETAVGYMEGVGELDLVFDRSGVPHLSASSWAGILHATRTTAGWVRTIHGTLGPASLAVDAADQPHIAVVASATLQYHSLASGAWQVENVDEGVGSVSLQIDGLGRPLIAYGAPATGLLKLAWKENGIWKKQVVDAGRSGLTASLALAGGLDPRISYFDELQWDLRYAAGPSPPPNRPPVADAGGPYSGAVGEPIEFDGSASSDPDGDPLSCLWDFGDGASATGARAQHTFVAAGEYEVTLTASDGGLSGTARAGAIIRALLTARAFVMGGTRTLPITSESEAVLRVYVESEDGSYQNADVDVATVTMRCDSTGSVAEIAAVADKVAMAGDHDRNGIEELQVSFRREDLAKLFENLEGRSRVRAMVGGLLTTGARFEAPLDLTVTSIGRTLAARIYPNPLNPFGTLRLTLPRPGPLRVALYDASGRLVRRIVDEPWAPAGLREISIGAVGGDDGRRGAQSLASGVYFYRVDSTGKSVTGRVVVAK